VGFSPLLVVEDLLLGPRGVILLPAIPRAGLCVCVGDVVDVVHDEERDEVVVLGLEPDHDPARVRLRLAARVPIGVGFEVWPSQTQSHVMLKRPDVPVGDAPRHVVALSKRRG